MRVLCTVTGSQGHARAVLPLARAAAKAGHDVLVVTPPELADVFEPGLMRIEPVLPGMVEAIGRMVQERQEAEAAGTPRRVLDTRDQLIATASGPHVTTAYQKLYPLAKEFQPDIVVRDGAELSGALVAEQLGVPYISAPSGAGNLIDPAGLVEPLNERRQELGLAAEPDAGMVHRYGRFDCLPADTSFAAFDLPTPFTYRQPSEVATGEVLPPEIAALPADRPLVLASVGTALPMLGAFKAFGIDPPEEMEDPDVTVRALIEGLSSVDCSAVVATAGFPIGDVEVGDNVLVVERMPQPLLLECAQLFLTHAGYNSIREALRAGVPMATLPQFGDQPHNARRVEELGFGKQIPATTPEAVAETCRAVLADTRIAATVARAQRRSLTMPGVESAVAHLEELAGRAAGTE
ncbi:glycosyltransferase [Amycolatopsis japonica]